MTWFQPFVLSLVEGRIDKDALAPSARLALGWRSTGAQLALDWRSTGLDWARLGSTGLDWARLGSTGTRLA
ncbi:unnamed protein product [Protopolystoma xenopodis]|uniref:Uncharacterized protein n=1 Tax=Protopolystoma xenopodis TaxID=117903 RepID=A0A3S5B7J1_9PLAT|nr:unnamed protein product [Protopolystoma xenopodis]